MAGIRIDRSKMRREFGRLSDDLLRSGAGGAAVAQREQVSSAFKRGGQPGRKWPGLWADAAGSPGSFRRGGEALRDTGALEAGFNIAEIRVAGGRATSSIGTPLIHAAFHQEGFSTSGPNYIPLTLKGRRLHQRGQDPRVEGLVKGKDYVMAWSGVDVPARPIIDYSDPINKRHIEESIADAMGA